MKARISSWLGYVAASETREKKREIELENAKETARSKDLY